MRAYKCDACGQVFLLPDNSLNFSGPEDDDIDDVHVPGQLYIYRRSGVATCMDLCKDCLDKMMDSVQHIKETRDMDFVRNV